MGLYDLDQSALKKTNSKRNTKLWVIAIAGFSLLMIFAFIFLVFHFLVFHAGSAPTDPSSQLNPASAVKDSEIKQFATDFCIDFFNISYSTYELAKERTQKKMTPQMQSAYQQMADNLEFIKKIKTLGVATPEFHIENFEFPQITGSQWQGKDAIIVHGEITYTLAVNRAKVAMPIQVLLIFENDPVKGLLIDNVILL